MNIIVHVLCSFCMIIMHKIHVYIEWARVIRLPSNLELCLLNLHNYWPEMVRANAQTMRKPKCVQVSGWLKDYANLGWTRYKASLKGVLHVRTRIRHFGCHDGFTGYLITCQKFYRSLRNSSSFPPDEILFTSGQTNDGSGVLALRAMKTAIW